MVELRLRDLRLWMSENGFEACVVPQTDPHMSEYVEKHDELRSYFSGFTGSAGTLVVTQIDAGLWTDSRYFIQAEIQLKGSGIGLYKIGLPDTPSMIEWTLSRVESTGRVAANAMCFTKKDWQEWNSSVLMIHSVDFESCWRDRPLMSLNPCRLFPLEYAGITAQEKLASLRLEMDLKSVDACFISTLDDIAWLLNVRGEDVEYVPVVRSYLWISKQQIKWWVDTRKIIDPSLVQQLKSLDVIVLPYESIEDTLGSDANAKSVWVDTSLLNARLCQLLEATYAVVDAPLWTTHRKATKNKVELQGMQQAMLLDGVAWVRSLKWLEEHLSCELTELDFQEAMITYKKSSSHYLMESFEPIVGYGSNAAIVHYSATPQSNKVIGSSGFLLVDAGSHYEFGTTDATRTIACGPLSDWQCKCYTWVLKGMIAVASARFAQETVGVDLDAKARYYLKENGLDYGHGTGHGVGHVLSVHERGATLNARSTKPLLAGMVLSDEPGYYQEGDFGIRIENMLAVSDLDKSTYTFSVLTLIPLELKAICIDLLSSEEKKWVNDYHRRIRESLFGLLTEEEYNWLKNKTYEI